MKKIIIYICLIIGIIVFRTGISNAWTLIWDPSTNATGYKVNYYPTSAPAEIIVKDVGSKTNFNLDAMEVGLINGTEYDFWVTAYDENTESSPSNTIRWIKVSRPIVIKLLGAPMNIMIEP